jgi:hypothetical protein
VRARRAVAAEGEFRDDRAAYECATWEAIHDVEISLFRTALQSLGNDEHAWRAKLVLEMARGRALVK